GYVADLRRSYSPETAEHLLESLRSAAAEEGSAEKPARPGTPPSPPSQGGERGGERKPAGESPEVLKFFRVQEAVIEEEPRQAAPGAAPPAPAPPQPAGPFPGARPLPTGPVRDPGRARDPEAPSPEAGPSPGEFSVRDEPLAPRGPPSFPPGSRGSRVGRRL